MHCRSSAAFCAAFGVAALAMAGCQTLENSTASNEVAVAERPSKLSLASIEKNRVFNKRAVLGLPALNLEWPLASGTPDNNPGHLLLGGGTPFQRRLDKAVKDIKITTRPVAAFSTLFVGDATGRVHAFSQADGAIAWSTLAAQDNPVTALAIVGGQVIAGHKDGTVRAHIPNSGKTIWISQAANTRIKTLLISKALTFALDEAGRIHALNHAKGETEWQSDVKHQAKAIVVSNGRIKALTASNTLVTFDSGSGKEIGKPAQVTADKLLVGSNITVTAAADKVTVWDSKTGQEKRSIVGKVEDNVVLSETSLFFMKENGSLVAHSVADGTLLWSIALPVAATGIKTKWFGPILAGGRLHLTANTGYVAAIDATDGRLLTLRNMGEAINTAPLVAAGRLFVITASGTFARF